MPKLSKKTKEIDDEEKGKFRGWCLTINNYTSGDISQFIEYDAADYMCYSFEVGEKGTPHIQGYIHHINPIHFRSVKKHFVRAHIEGARGSPQQNITYCSKQCTDKNPLIEFGLRPHQGRTKKDKDGKEVPDKLKVTDSLTMSNDEIRETWPTLANSLIYNRNKRKEKDHKGKNENKRVIYITGPSETGKTELAYSIAGEGGQDYDVIRCKNDFVNGYDNEEKNIVWDEFRDTDCSLTDFLMMCDKFSARINTKHGHELFYTNLLVITSIVHPDEIYKNCGEDRHQINRRIHKIIVTERWK